MARSCVESIRLALHQPTVRYAILFFGILTIGGIAPVFFFQPFLTRHDIDLSQVGFWQTPTRVMGVVGALVAYRVVSRLGRKGDVLPPASGHGGQLRPSGRRGTRSTRRSRSR